MLKIYKTIRGLRTYLAKQKKAGKSIGFVPTMGALHDGHLSLMKQAKSENYILVVSIFVNPLQFNNKEDLEKYPSTIKKDIELLKKVKCDVLFAPKVKEMYPKANETAKQYDLGYLNEILEGEYRPGHFQGVAVVVNKLFDIVQPDNAYFGEKDYQQLLIIRRMVELEKHKVNIIPCPIIREKDGLAMSSRNKRLTEVQRKNAPFIREMMLEAAKMSENKTLQYIKTFIQRSFEENEHFELEYFEICDKKTLKPLEKLLPKNRNIACITAYMGKIRLIDNIIF